MNNPPAFPTGTGVTPYNPGMTLRDYFAAQALQGMFCNDTSFATKAMQGMFCNDTSFATQWQVQVARDAYAMADAMLKAREA